jgi:hypothetical protein
VWCPLFYSLARLLKSLFFGLILSASNLLRIHRGISLFYRKLILCFLLFSCFLDPSAAKNLGAVELRAQHHWCHRQASSNLCHRVVNMATFSKPFTSPTLLDKEENDEAKVLRIEGDWTSHSRERSIDVGRVASYREDDSCGDSFSDGSDPFSEDSDPYQQLLSKIWVDVEQEGRDAVESESRDDVEKIKEVFLTKSWVDVEQESWGDVGTEGRDDVEKGDVETDGWDDVEKIKEMGDSGDGCSVATEVGNSLNVNHSKSDESKWKRRARLERMIERVIMGKISGEVGDAAQKNVNDVVIEQHSSRLLVEQSGHRQTVTSNQIMATPTTRKAIARQLALVRGSAHFIQRRGKNEYSEKVDDGNEEDENKAVPTPPDNVAKPLVAFISGANIIKRAKAQMRKNINSSSDVYDEKTSPSNNKENEAPAIPTRTSAKTNKSAGIIAFANKMRNKGSFKKRGKLKKRVTHKAKVNDDKIINHHANDENAERTFREVADAAMAAAAATGGENVNDATTAAVTGSAVEKREVTSRSRDTNPCMKIPRSSQKNYRSKAPFHKEADVALAAAEAAEVKKKFTTSVLDVPGLPETCDNGEGANSCEENPILENDAAYRRISLQNKSFEFDAVVTASSDEDEGFIGTATHPEDEVEEEIHVDACPATEPSTTTSGSAAPPCDPRKINYVHLLMPYLVNYGAPAIQYPHPPPPMHQQHQHHYFGSAAAPQNNPNYYYVTSPQAGTIYSTHPHATMQFYQ